MFRGFVQAIGTWHACRSTSAWFRVRRSRGGLSDIHLVRDSGLEFACHDGGLQRRTHGWMYRGKVTLGHEVPGVETRNTIDRGDPVPVPVPVRPPDLVPDLFHVHVLHTCYCYFPAEELQEYILEPRNEVARELHRVVGLPSTIYGGVADQQVRVGADGPGACRTDIQLFLGRMWHMSRGLNGRKVLSPR
jgi:hypothetical protein